MHALLIAMAIDDIGKDSSVSEEMAQQGVKATYADHSDLVHKAALANVIQSLKIVPAPNMTSSLVLILVRN